MKNRSKDWLINYICFVIFATNMSQLSFLVDLGITQLLIFPCWGILLILALLTNPKINQKAFTPLMLGVFVLALIAITSIFKGSEYMDTRIFYCLIITLGVFFITSLLPDEATNEVNIAKFFDAYIYSSTMLALAVYVEYFTEGIDFSSRLYVYDSKNSTAQIFLTALILCVYTQKKRRLGWLKMICALINIILLVLVRSRASLVGLIIVVIMAIFSKQINSNIRKMIAICFLGLVVLFFVNADVNRFVMDGLVYAGRSATSIQDITSGRSAQWKMFPQLFWENFCLGRGAYKIESFPLSVLLQYGLLFGSIMLIYSVLPMIYALKNTRKAFGNHILFLIGLVYWLNGIFEELAPFGPGVKCYFLWFLLAIQLKRNGIVRKEE